MITFPTTPEAYQFAPWTDPNGIQWIYDATIPAWARYRVAGGGTALTSYVSQVASLSDYPTTFPNDEVTAATSAATPDTLVKRAASSGNVTLTEVSCNGFELRGPTIYASFTSADNLTANRTYQDPNADGVKALTANTSGIPDSITNGTLSGATWTFGTGTAVAFFTALVNGNESTARTELGLTVTGDALATAATPIAARSVLGEQTKLAASTTSTTGGPGDLYRKDITGLTGFQIAANTWYKVEFQLWVTCLATVGYQIHLEFSQNLNPAAVTSQGGLGLVAAVAGTQPPFQTAATRILLRGGTAATTNQPHSGFLYFHSGSVAGTAAFRVSNDGTGAGTCSVNSGFASIIEKITD